MINIFDRHENYTLDDSAEIWQLIGGFWAHYKIVTFAYLLIGQNNRLMW